jgi:hypothetical protein
MTLKIIHGSERGWIIVHTIDWGSFNCEVMCQSFDQNEMNIQRNYYDVTMTKWQKKEGQILYSFGIQFSYEEWRVIITEYILYPLMS